MAIFGFFDSLAMYGRNFKPKIFTNITMPAKQSYGPNIGKKPHVFESLNFLRQSQCITANAKPEAWNGYL